MNHVATFSSRRPDRRGALVVVSRSAAFGPSARAAGQAGAEKTARAQAEKTAAALSRPRSLSAGESRVESEEPFRLSTLGGGRPVEVGRVSPDGMVEVVCDLPASERKQNITSKGLGCCVFRSIDYAARWQQVPELYDLPEQMVQAGIPGGGYPQKVDAVLQQFAPDATYLNDTSGDPEILEALLATGRMPCVTYDGRDCHYAGRIAHMVCLPYFDRATGWACISDNNFPEEGRFVWMSANEFLQRWKGGGGGGWVCALLALPPPPPPYN